MSFWGTPEFDQWLGGSQVEMGKNCALGAGETAQQLRTLSALVRHLGSILVPTWWLTTTWNSRFRRLDPSDLRSSPDMQVVHT